MDAEQVEAYVAEYNAQREATFAELKRLIALIESPLQEHIKLALGDHLTALNHWASAVIYQDLQRLGLDASLVLLEDAMRDAKKPPESTP